MGVGILTQQNLKNLNNNNNNNNNSCPIPALQKTPILRENTNWLMLLSELPVSCPDRHTKRANTLSEKM